MSPKIIRVKGVKTPMREGCPQLDLLLAGVRKRAGERRAVIVERHVRALTVGPRNDTSLDR
jgi:hypothetical protein